MIVLTVVLSALAAFVLLTSVSECLSLLRLLWIRKPAAPAPPVEPPFLLFLVLAHNEELLLPTCIRSLLTQRYPTQRRRVVVVADNCTDRTEELASAGGAEVLVRTDPELRGKPRAIAWALDRLDLTECDAVVIIDGDTEVIPGFAAELAARAPLRGKVVQPFIGVQNPEESALTRMAQVHGRAVHGLAYQLKQRVGLNVPLGVGMCIGTDVLRTHGWPAFSIGEDHELYGVLTALGIRIEPQPAAVITAQEASGLKQSSSQRHRWMTGQRHALVNCTRGILTSPHIGFAQRLDAMAELSWFGPVVSVWFGVVGAGLSLLLNPPGAHVLALLFLLSLVRQVAYTVLAIALDPAPFKALRAFLYLPVYLFWRIGPAIRSLLPSGEHPWVRTDRSARAGVRL